VKESGLNRKRGLIEGVFGNIKDKLESHIRVRDEQLAKIYGLIRMLIYNI